MMPSPYAGAGAPGAPPFPPLPGTRPPFPLPPFLPPGMTPPPGFSPPGPNGLPPTPMPPGASPPPGMPGMPPPIGLPGASPPPPPPGPQPPMTTGPPSLSATHPPVAPPLTLPNPSLAQANPPFKKATVLKWGDPNFSPVSSMFPIWRMYAHNRFSGGKAGDASEILLPEGKRRAEACECRSAAAAVARRRRGATREEACTRGGLLVDAVLRSAHALLTIPAVDRRATEGSREDHQSVPSVHVSRFASWSHALCCWYEGRIGDGRRTAVRESSFRFACLPLLYLQYLSLRALLARCCDTVGVSRSILISIRCVQYKKVRLLRVLVEYSRQVRRVVSPARV